MSKLNMLSMLKILVESTFLVELKKVARMTPIHF
jgi:hypothetical protein